MKKRLSLPSGRVVQLTLPPPGPPRARLPGEPLFAEASALLGDGRVSDAQGAVDVDALALRDFHVLRAIAMRLGYLAEDPVAIACRNCGVEIVHHPAAALALGPFVDGELDDPELDGMLDLSRPHPIPEVTLPGGACAREVTLRPLVVADARPLFRALRRRSLALSARVVVAMGIRALGHERRPDRIARALDASSERAFTTITDLFLSAHYSQRLFSIAWCGSCRARNDVDAPYEREFERGEAPPQHSEFVVGSAAPSNEEGFPSFDAFNEAARAIGARLLAGDPDVAFVVDGEVPACDDGGDPLLGSYVPPYEGDATTPSGGPEITVYYRTFRALAEEEGAYDWRAELEETVEHELEHHAAHLRGFDATDEEERAEIAAEALRVRGRKAAAREEVSLLGKDLAGFLRRTWPFWLLAVIATLIVAFGAR